MNAARRQLVADLDRLRSETDPAARRVGAALHAVASGGLGPQELGWVTAIEDLRRRLESSDRVIDVALPNHRGATKPAPLGETCRTRSKKRPWVDLLLALARTAPPARAVELGSCMGISTAYLAAGLRLGGAVQLVSLEGAPALAELTAKNLAELGLDGVRVEAGLFATTLAPALAGGGVGLAFVDGHHQEEPTLAYFDQLTGHLTDPAVVVFDDIRWSEGMERAWTSLRADPRVSVVVDIDRVGICVVGRGDGEQRQHRFPTLSRMQSLLAQEVRP